MLATKEIQSTWQEQFNSWLATQSAEKTVKAYQADLRVFSRWFQMANGEEFQPSLINSTDLRSFRQWSLEVERVQPATWNRRRAALIALGQYAKQMGLRVVRVIDVLERADEVELAPRWLSQADTRRIMREMEIAVNAANTEPRRIRAIRDQAIVGLMLYAGLRISEVLALHVSDVTICERKGSVSIRSGKGGVFAQVPLSTSARLLVRSWLEVRRSQDEHLFTSENGSAIKERGVQARIQQLADRLGIEGLHAHALRHSCAKNALDASNGHLTEVQKLMRHKRITTTTRYTTPSLDELQDLVEIGELGKLNHMMEAR